MYCWNSWLEIYNVTETTQITISRIAETADWKCKINLIWSNEAINQLNNLLSKLWNHKIYDLMDEQIDALNFNSNFEFQIVNN